MNQNKSVLDGMKVKEEGFPLGGKQPSPPTLDPSGLVVVGECKTCGNPIYGPRRVNAQKTGLVLIRRSCNCSHAPDGGKSLAGTTRTT